MRRKREKWLKSKILQANPSFFSTGFEFSEKIYSTSIILTAQVALNPNLTRNLIIFMKEKGQANIAIKLMP